MSKLDQEGLLSVFGSVRVGNLDAALVEAVEQNDFEIVVKLLEKGASPDACRSDGECIINYALKNEDLETALELLKRNANTNNGYPTLLVAAELGYFEFVDAMLERGADINIRDEDGNTALMIECRDEPSLANVLELIKRGADVNIQNARKETALMFTADEAHYLETGKVLMVLLENGANALLVDADADNALERLSEDANEELREELLKRIAPTRAQLMQAIDALTPREI